MKPKVAISCNEGAEKAAELATLPNMALKPYIQFLDNRFAATCSLVALGFHKVAPASCESRHLKLAEIISSWTNCPLSNLGLSHINFKTFLNKRFALKN